MKKVIEFMKGKKTYLVALMVGIVAVAQFLGWIDMSVATLLYGVLGAGGTASLRNAIINSK